MTSGYDWIEIVSVNPLKAVKLGCLDTHVTALDFINLRAGISLNDNFKKVAASYNRAITTLHEEAQEYLSSVADRSRCLGSDPRNPAKDTKETRYTNNETYMETFGWNYKFKEPDTNYTNNGVGIKKDWDQLYDISLGYIDHYSGYLSYCLASRNVFVDSAGYTNFGVAVVEYGQFVKDKFCSIKEGQYGYNGNPQYGFRPVIRLKSGVQISNPTATGSSTDPYELTI